MTPETNLEFIKSMGEQKEEENWKFRAYLKGLNIKSKELDKIVRTINDDVSSQIDCTKCGNCCKVIYPILDEKDAAAFSEGLNKSIEEFKSSFLVVDKEEGEDKYKFNSLPCPFLKENKCTNYSHRPEDCRSFPHLQKENFVFRLMGVIEFYSICPIVFNVYEQLKKDLWRRDLKLEDRS